MSQTTQPSASPLRPEAVLPPEEMFWKRYSPHHEFPLSSVTAVAIHALALCLVVLGAAALWKAKQKDLPPTSVVEVGEPDGTGPEGGSLPGLPAAAGPTETAESQTPKEEVASAKPSAPTEAIKEPKKTETPTVDPIETVTQPVDPAKTSDVLNGIASAASERIKSAVAKGPTGQGGKGTGPGTGQGANQGNGDGNGKPRGTLDVRERRQRRWNLVFDAPEGHDYLRQLAGVGAIIAVPMPDKPNSFFVLRNPLDRNSMKEEDLAQFKQLYWVDDKPESVGKVARALGLPFVPAFFASFMPQEFEDALLKRELEALRKQRPGGKEEDIALTEFRLRPKGRGQLEPFVTNQRLRARER